MIAKISLSLIKKHLPSLLTLIFLLLLWQWLVDILKIPGYILPSPLEIISEIIQKKQYLIRHSLITLIEILTGFALGMLIAFIISLGILYSKIMEKVIYPLLIFTQVTPKIAIAPLFLIWFGYGLLPKIVVTALVAFFPIIINTVKGLKSIDMELADLMYSLSATKRQILNKIRIPSSLPYVFAGLKVSISLSVIGAIVGEFVGADRGLGYIIMISNANLETAQVFACLIILSIMGVGLFLAICLIESLYSWQKSAEFII
ncbi:MAG: ABC transporter permease [Candidatus Omnitrophica bacterium]|nr:ABC transporter permease [Candidatus Omnitrophota bacterium]